MTAGQSLVLPILDRGLPAEHIDLYQSSADQRHPLAAIALTNDGETGLPPGVLTLYEQTASGATTYLGDARLAALPPNEKRMLSYAVDTKVTVDRSSEEQHAIVKAAIARCLHPVSGDLSSTPGQTHHALSDGCFDDRMLLLTTAIHGHLGVDGIAQHSFLVGR